MFKGIVCGRLGKDAQSASVGDSTVISFNLATDVGLGDRKHTVWVRCNDWRPWATKLLPYLIKGKEVTVYGALDLREYESNGETKTSLELRVEDVTLHGGAQWSPAAGESSSGNVPF